MKQSRPRLSQKFDKENQLEAQFQAACRRHSIPRDLSQLNQKRQLARILLLKLAPDSVTTPWLAEQVLSDHEWKLDSLLPDLLHKDNPTASDRPKNNRRPEAKLVLAGRLHSIITAKSCSIAEAARFYAEKYGLDDYNAKTRATVYRQQKLRCKQIKAYRDKARPDLFQLLLDRYRYDSEGRHILALFVWAHTHLREIEETGKIKASVNPLFEQKFNELCGITDAMSTPDRAKIYDTLIDLIFNFQHPVCVNLALLYIEPLDAVDYYARLFDRIRDDKYREDLLASAGLKPMDARSLMILITDHLRSMKCFS